MVGVTDFFRKRLGPRVYSKLFRFALNIWPCMVGAGGRVIFLSPDFRRMEVRIKLSWRTRNLVGTIFGGSMYASTDPMYMIMLIEILGKDFVVWDKGCTIRFKRPAKIPITAVFEVTPAMESEVRERVERENEATFTWTVQYKDSAGVVYSEFDKVLYVAKKDFYREKLRRRAEG